MTVVGIGCRSGVTEEEISAAFATILGRYGVERSAIDALASEHAKIGEAGLLAFAAAMTLPLILVGPNEMHAAAGGAISKSERLVALKGVPSIAEVAALAAAGRSARLLGPRTLTASVACAIAVGEGA